MANCMLPEDVVFSILLGLPVISLLRFRSVCKTWCTLIGSSSFVNQHLLHQSDNNDNLIVTSPQKAEWLLLSGHGFQTRLNLDIRTQWSLYFPMAQNGNLRRTPLMVGSCNGIICLCRRLDSDRTQLGVWNPSIKEFTCLPEPPVLPTKLVYINTAFGYAVKANVYKVVRVLEFQKSDYSVYRQVQIYNIQPFSNWRNIDINLSSSARTNFQGKTYWCGHISWLIREPDTYVPSANFSILTFDLSDEIFGTMFLPDILSNQTDWPHLSTMSDSIALIDNIDPYHYKNGVHDIWVLTKYGAKESWTKLYTITSLLPKGFGPATCIRPEIFSKNGQFLFLSIWTESGCQLVLYDQNTQQTTTLHSDSEYTRAAIYTESLVSVKRMMRQIW